MMFKFSEVPRKRGPWTLIIVIMIIINNNTNTNNDIVIIVVLIIIVMRLRLRVRLCRRARRVGLQRDAGTLFNIM